MNRLIQLVGIPGSGKSHILNRILLEGINYIEFGREFKEKYTKAELPVGTEPSEKKSYQIKEFLNLIIQNRQPAIFTSHIVRYNDGIYNYDRDLEVYAACAGYVFVFSKPEDILSRRQRDNQLEAKPREVGTVASISQHQDLSFDFAKCAAADVGARFLRIDNLDKDLETNLFHVRTFVTEVLLP